MRTFLMVGATLHDLRCWQVEWLDLNAPNVSAHDAARKLTTMRNGDVYLWRLLESRALCGVKADAAFIYKRPYTPTPEQREALELLRTRVR